MEKVKEFLIWILVFFLLLATVYIKKIANINPIVINTPQFVTKKVEKIVIRGSLEKEKITGEKVKDPITITLKRSDNDTYSIDKKETELPSGMTLNSIDTIKKMDWIEPARISYMYNISTKEKRIAVSYTLLRVQVYKRFRVEFGPETDFKSIGLSAGLFCGNIGIIGSYDISKTTAAGISLRPF